MGAPPAALTAVAPRLTAVRAPPLMTTAEVKFRLYLPEHGETAAYCHVSASEGVELDDMLRGDLDMQRGRMPVLLRALLESLYVEEEEEEAAEDAGEQEEEQSGAESDASAN